MMNAQSETTGPLLGEFEPLPQQVAALRPGLQEKQSEAEDGAEREHVEQALRASEENLRSFFNTIHDLLFVIALDGRILWANSTALIRLGYREEELLGCNVMCLHPEDRRQEARQVFGSLVDGTAIVCPVPLVTKLGRLIPVETTVVFGRWNGENVLFGVSKDISEWQASEERFAKAFQSNPSPMALSSADNGFIEVNEALLRTLGYERDEVVGKSAGDLNLFVEPARQWEAVATLYQDGHLRDCPLDVRAKNGRIYHGLFSGEIIQLRNQQVMLTVMEDITERKRAEEALAHEHRILKHLLQASDHERQIIAYEIHDGLAQQLAGAIMHFQTFEHLKETRPVEAFKAFDTGMAMLRQGHFETRRLIADVRHPILDELGVIEALVHLVHEQGRKTEAEILFKCEVLFNRLVPTLENAIYRISQEGIANACQYSQSKQVRLSLVQRRNRLRLEIRDWGVGFDTKAVVKNHFGLEGIRQRARLLGGKYRLRSSPEGTQLTVELPVVERE